MFTKILIANRGEIAVRIIRACREMGIETVVVYSEADAESLPVAMADERICIGGNSPKDSYLNMENIISAALVTKAQAIHPGYGFLSENPEFAKKCDENGIVFIGPPWDVIKLMGDKEKARELMSEIGVPIVPGSGVITSIEEAEAEADRIGYPVMIKASAGGGGKGIRVVFRKEELAESIRVASEEARSGFGNADVFMEKYLVGVRHIEVQVLADKFGNIVCLGERDCSLQRNKQKVIEETPSPFLSDELRERLMETAKKAMKFSYYENAGTVEFLVDKEGNFYFIEMNTRLQVEHPITEELTGIDIVKWQIRIACEMKLNFTQEDVQFKGHVIECRINARSTGNLNFIHIPGGKGVRCDTAMISGMEVVPYYDSMLGKLIARSLTREETVRKMESALCEMIIDGVETNQESQIDLIRSQLFYSGMYDTRSLEDR
ncbi:MAG: acetyl-CoA carboxylase biotin carboxylase subunit [Firmicutes bacterium]|nr:acetyl-CoA carboxylase biotin carboxylase subunit [Bacillota bacterium]MBQ7241799.1 acetyl-CoA carboxylase biotin carboxylase subunit [Bacillota bacterium]MBR0104669.1 acetyl-CoA carboxylase biotin carboxylase subunit [Bacillota bacterium]